MNSYDKIVHLHTFRYADGDTHTFALTESGRVFERLFDLQKKTGWTGWDEAEFYPPGCDPNPHVKFQ